MPVGPGVPGGPYMQMPDSAHAQAQAYQQYMQQQAAIQQTQAQRAGYMPQQHAQMQQPHPTQSSWWNWCVITFPFSYSIVRFHEVAIEGKFKISGVSQAKKKTPFSSFCFVLSPINSSFKSFWEEKQADSTIFHVPFNILFAWNLSCFGNMISPLIPFLSIELCMHCNPCLWEWLLCLPGGRGFGFFFVLERKKIGLWEATFFLLLFSSTTSLVSSLSLF